MPLKATANGLAAFGSARRPRLPRIPPAPVEIPPAQGCSRWVSCRCCRQTSSGGAPRAKRWFATTAVASRDMPSASGSAPAHVAVRQAGSGSTLSGPRRENEPHAHHLRAAHTMPMSDLPLPPPLPFSPDSLPFQRHLSVLSLSLVDSSPDRSWVVYRALHPSLRRCLPDETFQALVARQRECESREVAWRRVRSLLMLGGRNGTHLGNLGVEELGAVFMLGMSEEWRTPSVGELAEDDVEDEIAWVGQAVGAGGDGVEAASGPPALTALHEDDPLFSLWRALATLSPDLRNISLPVRRSWLLYLTSILKNRRAIGTPHSPDFTRIQDELRQFIRGGGARRLNVELGRILQLMSSGVNAKGHARVLRWMVWCESRKVNVHQNYLASTMMKLWTYADKEGKDGKKVLAETVEDLLAGKMFDEVGSRADRTRRGDKVREVLKGVIYSRADKAMELLQGGELGLEEINTLGHSLALLAKNGESKQAVVNWDGAVRLLAAALQLVPEKDRDLDAVQNPKRDVESLVGAISVSLTSGTQMYDTAEYSPDDVTPIILRFLTLVVDANLLITLPADIAAALFHLCLSTLPDPAAFPLTRAIYPFARVLDPPWVWGKRSPSTWGYIFYHALAPESRDIEWASRLYTDSLADGAPVGQVPQLAMIHAIGQVHPWDPSRSVLLERHIKDYLWDETLDRPSLVEAVVGGLTTPKHTTAECISDAEIALGLAERLSPPGEPFAAYVTSRIIFQLSRSPDPAHLTKVRELLLQLPPTSEHTTTSYDTVLSHLVGMYRHLSPEEMLAQVISVYRELLEREVGASSRTVSVMIRALLEAGHTDSALGVFRSCVEQRLLVMSDAAGQLMVRLGLAGRDVESREVERQWREVQQRVSPTAWDRGVVGAKVLLDTREGKEVDLKEIERRTGWVGGESYLKFVESQRPPRDGGRGQGEAALEESVDQRASWEVEGEGAGGKGVDMGYRVEREKYSSGEDERGLVYGRGGLAPAF
ncbi:hypothetical protein IAT38_005352 [Cryptococcus sp. DSM 104549]